MGTSLGTAHVSFIVGQGIVNEVYYPRVDLPQVRDLGFTVSDGAGFWQEVKGTDDCRVELAEPGVPAVTVVHPPPALYPHTAHRDRALTRHAADRRDTRR